MYHILVGEIDSAPCISCTRVWPSAVVRMKSLYHQWIRRQFRPTLEIRTGEHDRERGREMYKRELFAQRHHQPGIDPKQCKQHAATWLPIPFRLLCLQSARPHSTLLRRQRQIGCRLFRDEPKRDLERSKSIANFEFQWSRWGRCSGIQYKANLLKQPACVVTQNL